MLVMSFMLSDRPTIQLISTSQSTRLIRLTAEPLTCMNPTSRHLLKVLLSRDCLSRERERERERSWSFQTMCSFVRSRNHRQRHQEKRQRGADCKISSTFARNRNHRGTNSPSTPMAHVFDTDVNRRTAFLSIRAWQRNYLENISKALGVT